MHTLLGLGTVMVATGHRRWDVSNSRCDMQICVDQTHVHIAVDAGKYESYRCHLKDYLEEQAVAPNISLREMVRRNAGDVLADELAREVRSRLHGMPNGPAVQQA